MQVPSTSLFGRSLSKRRLTSRVGDARPPVTRPFTPIRRNNDKFEVKCIDAEAVHTGIRSNPVCSDMSSLPVRQSEFTFVNLTDNPAKGRDERRVFVRQTVMSDYHKRRRQLSNPLEATLGGRTTYVPLVGSDGGYRGQGDLTGASLEPVIRRSEDADSAQILIPLGQRSAQLFQPIPWVDPHHAQISRLVVRFLCGQPVKAAHDISYVAFVHRQFKHACALDKRDHPLKDCGQLLGTFSSGTSSASGGYTTFWAKVHKHQEDMYAQVRHSSKRTQDTNLVSLCIDNTNEYLI